MMIKKKLWCLDSTAKDNVIKIEVLHEALGVLETKFRLKIWSMINDLKDGGNTHMENTLHGTS